MSETFTKLFSSITESTVWGEPYHVRIVWVAMLAMADQNGDVFSAVPGLARRANVTLPEAEEALACFLSPDPYSRTADNDGRRIEPIVGGWNLLNHAKYRAHRDPEVRREQNREAQKRLRDKQKVSQSKPESAEVSPSESDTDTEERTNARAKPARTSSRFDEFWQAYPVKKGKAKALAKWKALGLDAYADMILAHVKHMLANDRSWQEGYIPHGSTYITGQRWEDAAVGDKQQPAQAPRQYGAASALQSTETPLERAVGFINQQHRLGRLTDDERTEKLREAREKHGNGGGNG